MISKKIILPVLLIALSASPICAIPSQSWFERIKNSSLNVFLYGGLVTAPFAGLYAGFKAGVHTPKSLPKKFLIGAATATGVTWASWFFLSKATPLILRADDRF